MLTLKDIPPDILRDRHRLTPQQINTLTGAGPADEDAEGTLSALSITGEFIRVSDALIGSAIRFIPLKGPELSYRMYGDTTSRYYRDLDILVDVADLNRTALILEGLGYRAETLIWPAGSSRQRVIVKHTNEISFFNPGKRLTIELHWRLLKTPVVSYSRLEEMVRENMKELNIAGRSFTVLSNELELLYLVIHGGNHWWRRLKWLIDIDTFIRSQTIDRDLFNRLTEELKAERLVGLCNAVLEDYMPGSVLIAGRRRAPEFMVRFTHKMIVSQKELTDDFYSRITGSVLFSLISFPGMRYKISTLRNYLFVVPFYGKNKILSSLPLFYAYGPLRLAFRYLHR